MAKKNASTQPAKADLPSANSPLTAAVAATMPLVYSTQIALAQSSGPLPPPEFLRQYEALQPGTADRILKMAEDEANHRRKMEAEVIYNKEELRPSKSAGQQEPPSSTPTQQFTR